MTTKTQITNKMIKDYVNKYGSKELPNIYPNKIYAKIMTIGMINLEEKIECIKYYENEFLTWPIDKRIEFDRVLLTENKRKLNNAN